jgi:hypothetical protein
MPGWNVEPAARIGAPIEPSTGKSRRPKANGGYAISV